MRTIVDRLSLHSYLALMVSVILLATVVGSILIGATIAHLRMRHEKPIALGMIYGLSLTIPALMVAYPTCVLAYKSIVHCGTKCDGMTGGMTGGMTLVFGCALAMVAAIGGFAGAFVRLERPPR